MRFISIKILIYKKYCLLHKNAQKTLIFRDIFSNIKKKPCGFFSSFYKNMVGLNGLEPSTSPLSGVRSNQLSYSPIKKINKIIFLRIVVIYELLSIRISYVLLLLHLLLLIQLLLKVYGNLPMPLKVL